jgi:predicted acyltransferase
VALDALRGFAILTMVLSGVVPYGVLPAWMYHAQIPPPAHKFDPTLAGLTWVDLVFPFFLFSLGAAIPLALTRRLERGMSQWQAAATGLKRGALLAFFALFEAHLNPFALSKNPETVHYLAGLIAFALMFAIFTRLPETWPGALHWGIRAAGWAGAFALLAWARYPDGSGFKLTRSNIILLVLANVVTIGVVVWIFTRGRPVWRFGLLLLGLGIHLARYRPGWVFDLTQMTPAPWLFEPRFQKYLFIVIPGMIAGEAVEAWMRQRATRPEAQLPLSRPRLWWLAVLSAGFVLINLVGLQARWVEATVCANAILSCAGWLLLRPATGNSGCFLRTVFLWGVFWLMLGMVFEPYQGGIKKDHATISYYFVTSGLACIVLTGLTVVGDVLGLRGWLGLLSDNGQNPMIAYVGNAFFIAPVLALTGLGTLLTKATPGPWPGALRGAIITLLVGLMVMLFTRLRIYWRT